MKRGAKPAGCMGMGVEVTYDSIERRVVWSMRLSSVGSMAAGVASAPCTLASARVRSSSMKLATINGS